MRTEKPLPEFQLNFLQKLQRILSEGQFTATYKFAVLHALADLAITSDDNYGGPLILRTDDIAEKVIERYWRQAVPFHGEGKRGILRQIHSGEAAIVKGVRILRRVAVQ